MILKPVNTRMNNLVRAPACTVTGSPAVLIVEANSRNDVKAGKCPGAPSVK